MAVCRPVSLGALLRLSCRGPSEALQDLRQYSSQADWPPSAVLNTGAHIPLLGFGTYAGYKPETYTPDIVLNALRQGYRHLDTAESYFTEEAVGRGIQAAIQKGILKREDLFVTTKLWNDHHKRADVKPTLKASLERLGLDYVDAYLVHWPVTNTPGPELHPPYQETWEAMEELPATGLTKAIGVANLSIKKLEEVLSYARIVPCLNQVESHPLWRNDALLTFNWEHGIHTTAWAPLGGQIVVPSRLMDRPEIVQVAQRIGRSPAQVILRWGVQRGVSILPKSDLPAQMQENFSLDFELTQEDMDLLGGFKDQLRQHDSVDPVDPTFKMFLQPEGPWPSKAELWDDHKTYAAETAGIA